ncbi:MAG: hypothetical protein PSX36_08805 [bacterium]|nr:hypothetical protein [bacterium]
MTSAEFNELDLEHRCDAILEWGFFLGKNKSADSNRVLYSVNGYFAEINIRLADNKILEARAFTSMAASEKNFYLIDKENPFIKLLGGME